MSNPAAACSVLAERDMPHPPQRILRALTQGQLSLGNPITACRSSGFVQYCNEVPTLGDAILPNNAVMSADKTIKYCVEKFILRRQVADTIGSTESDFVRLPEAVLAEMQVRFVYAFRHRGAGQAGQREAPAETRL
jgi:hypothetical protein